MTVANCACGERYTHGLRSRDNSQIIEGGQYVCARCWNGRAAAALRAMPSVTPASELLPRIQETLQAGLRVQVSTCLRSVVYDKRHAGMFRASGPSLYVQRGKAWDCIDGCSIRFEREVKP